MKLVRLLLPCLLLIALCAPSAKAQNGLAMAYLYGYGYGGFNGYSVGAYNHSLPYFSLHPPVYYGKRYARPYGVSPFAAWPQLSANKSYAPVEAANLVSPYSTGCCGTVIENPYMPAESVPGKAVEEDAEVVQKIRNQPLVIENPYFRASQAVQYTAARGE